jgi:hypothetical protein
MIIGKQSFFLVLFTILILPFLVYKLLWITNSVESTGSMRYVGKRSSGQLTSEYSVIRFFVGKDTIWFNSMDNFILEKGTVIPVRYQRHRPADARINSFAGLWGDTLLYIVPLLVILLISFLHADIVPRGSRLRVSVKQPFIFLV